MSATHNTPTSLAGVAQDLVREMGPAIVVELVKMAADGITSGKLPVDERLLAAARKVFDVIPDPLPNVELDDRIDEEIDKRSSDG